MKHGYSNTTQKPRDRVVNGKVMDPKASESKEVEVESKSNAHCILRYSRHRSFRIPTPRPNSEPNRL